jgi:DNA anti-recombination protein RmuC
MSPNVSNSTTKESNKSEMNEISNNEFKRTVTRMINEIKGEIHNHLNEIKEDKYKRVTELKEDSNKWLVKIRKKIQDMKDEFKMV